MRLHDFFDYHVREQSDGCFAEFGDRTVTWADAGRQANRIANALNDCGVVPGERIAILAKNCIEYALLYYAAAKVGAVPVPLNYRLTVAEWRVILEDAAPTLVLARGEFVEAVAPLRTQLPSARAWVALDAPAPVGWTSYADWVADSSDEPPTHVVRDGDAVYQMYTSGTTGRPKGAVLTHTAVCANCAQLNVVERVSDRDRFLIVAPMYHAAAAINAFNAVAAGATLVIMEDFDPVAVAYVLARQRITATVLVPAMIQAILVHVPELETKSFAELRYIGYGGSPITAKTLRRAVEVFGCEFGQGFGMTEATAVATALTPEDHVRAMHDEPGLLLSCGRPLAGTDVRVVDAEDLDVPVGAIGEVLVGGPRSWGATGTCPMRPRLRWLGAGCTRVMPDASTTRATCTSKTGSRT